MPGNSGHVPVLLAEVREQLAPPQGAVIGDLTVGAAGHAIALLEEAGPESRLVGMDRDPVALAMAEERLEAVAPGRFLLVRQNFIGGAARLRREGIDEVDTLLLDLGVSSMQLDDPGRGFSFQADGPLDMRMSPKGKTAADLLRVMRAEELEQIFRDYGEEPRARDIARKIVDVRMRSKITRTKELAELVRTIVRKTGKMHPATRAFQALRIAVNGELDAVKVAVPKLCGMLRPGGRMGVITFHSLEDRIVKTVFKEEEEAGHVRVLTARPVAAGPEEVARNPRSRSAKLRCVECVVPGSKSSVSGGRR